MIAKPKIKHIGDAVLEATVNEYENKRNKA